MTPLSTVRRHRRTALGPGALTCDLSIDGPCGTDPVVGRITILGSGGAFVELTPGIDVGTVIGLRFRLPNDGGEIICAGVVRDNAAGGIGVEFTELTPGDRDRIDRSMRHLEDHTDAVP